MDQTFLLRTFDAVVNRVEVAHQDTLEILEQRPNPIPLAGLGKDERDLIQVREYPDVANATLEADLGLVGVNERPDNDALEQIVVRLPVNLSSGYLELVDCATTDVQTEEFVEKPGYRFLRQKKLHHLIYNEGAKSLTILLSRPRTVRVVTNGMATSATIAVKVVSCDPSLQPRATEAHIQYRL